MTFLDHTHTPNTHMQSFHMFDMFVVALSHLRVYCKRKGDSE